MNSDQEALNVPADGTQPDPVSSGQTAPAGTGSTVAAASVPEGAGSSGENTGITADTSPEAADSALVKDIKKPEEAGDTPDPQADPQARIRSLEQHCQDLEKQLADSQKDLATRIRNLTLRESRIRAREAEAEAGFPARVEELLKGERDALDQQRKKQEEATAKLLKDEGILRDRENAISAKEQEISQRLADLDGLLRQHELDEKARILRESEEERSRRMTALEADLEQEALKRRQEAEQILKDRTDDVIRRESLADSREQDLTRRERDLQNGNSALEADRKSLEERKASLEKKFADDEQAMRQKLEDEQSRLSDLVDRRTAQRQQICEQREQELGQEISTLQTQITDLNRQLLRFRDLEAVLGGRDPQGYLSELRSTQAAVSRDRSELEAKQIREATENEQRLKAEIDTLKKALRDRDEKLSQMSSSRTKEAAEREIEDLRNSCDYLKRLNAKSEAYARTVEQRFERLTAQLGSKKDRDDRIRDITIPYFCGVEKARQVETDPGETQWLDRIITTSASYGMSFPRRIVYAFHTCLKIAEWSPLTVLAGVSGTGKSELPRYYSLMGGMPFLPVAVQPNWDSQESMLGYFNSIDNRFDAQPVLRALAQATIPRSGDSPLGLGGIMNLILLDEMNLAHVELYFADFLSKLETRRGMVGKLPAVDVKLGAGIQPYELELTRNVMWVGTMNQDETTKALSDKVLDRGNVIFFPRPQTLQSRKDLKKLPPLGYLLTEKVWRNWCRTSTMIPEDMITPYKVVIERINDCLSYVGRALGHRVWQSIEYYMNNYPDVASLAAAGSISADDRTRLSQLLHIAFEDALVQKVMPKLRGIETEGGSRERCLEPIERLLNEGVSKKGFDLTEDFHQACENPFGQFIWNSANYVLKDEARRLKAQKDGGDNKNGTKVTV